MAPWDVLVLLKFEVNSQNLEFKRHTISVWIGNCNVKVWKSTEDKNLKLNFFAKIQENEHTPEWLLWFYTIKFCEMTGSYE